MPVRASVSLVRHVRRRPLLQQLLAHAGVVLEQPSHAGRRCAYGRAVVDRAHAEMLTSPRREFVELDGHPFWIGTQAHPEFKSRPDRPAPLFRAFVEAALRRAEGRNPQLLQVDQVDVGAAG